MDEMEWFNDVPRGSELKIRVLVTAGSVSSNGDLFPYGAAEPRIAWEHPALVGGVSEMLSGQSTSYIAEILTRFLTSKLPSSVTVSSQVVYPDGTIKQGRPLSFSGLKGNPSRAATIVVSMRQGQ